MEEANKENNPPQPLPVKKKPAKYFSDRQPGDKGFSIGIVERFSKSRGAYLQYVPSDSEESSDSDDGVMYGWSSEEEEEAQD
ncbi:unnamed protein product [Auanema sp. JU1783]|nr:unnamed protein product [Auanema sp. JU1783]